MQLYCLHGMMIIAYSSLIFHVCIHIVSDIRLLHVKINRMCNNDVLFDS